jgi:hypothetical protein
MYVIYYTGDLVSLGDLGSSAVLSLGPPPAHSASASCATSCAVLCANAWAATPAPAAPAAPAPAAPTALTDPAIGDVVLKGVGDSVDIWDSGDTGEGEGLGPLEPVRGLPRVRDRLEEEAERPRCTILITLFAPAPAPM